MYAAGYWLPTGRLLTAYWPPLLAADCWPPGADRVLVTAGYRLHRFLAAYYEPPANGRRPSTTDRRVLYWPPDTGRRRLSAGDWPTAYE